MIVIATKRCSGCGLDRAPECFNRGTSRCKDCKKKYDAAYFSVPENRARRLARKAAYRASPSGRKKRRVYGIQWTYRVEAPLAKSLLAVPVCQSCGGKFSHLGDERIDHCHDNSHVRGVVCQLCNTAMSGPAKECIDRLRGCIVYLERDREWQSLEASCPG